MRSKSPLSFITCGAALAGRTQEELKVALEGSLPTRAQARRWCSAPATGAAVSEQPLTGLHRSFRRSQPREQTDVALSFRQAARSALMRRAVYTVRLPLTEICACLILLTQYCISCECSTVLMVSWRVLNDTRITDHRTSNYVCRTYYRTPDLDCAADVRSYDDCGNSDNTIDETCSPLRIPSLSIYL